MEKKLASENAKNKAKRRSPYYIRTVYASPNLLQHFFFKYSSYPPSVITRSSRAVRGKVMSEKKGKAEAEGKRKGRLSRKKSPIAAPKPIVKVRYMKSPDIAKPVIGISLFA